MGTHTEIQFGVHAASENTVVHCISVDYVTHNNNGLSRGDNDRVKGWSNEKCVHS